MVDDEQRAHGEGAEQARVDADDQRAEEGEQPQRGLGFPLLPDDVKCSEVQWNEEGSGAKSEAKSGAKLTEIDEEKWSEVKWGLGRREPAQTPSCRGAVGIS